MASERDTALGAVVPQTPAGPPPLERAISEASSLAEQTKQLQLTHAHAIAMRNADLGWFGRVFGAEPQAAIVIAFIVVACGLIAAGGLWWVAYKSSGNSAFWSGEAHIALGAVTTALGYVFGRGSRDAPKS